MNKVLSLIANRLSQNQILSESVFEWVWEEDTIMTESKMAVSQFKMAEFKLAAIIKLS